MFQYIKGELIGTEPNGAVIECGGIGYKFTVSANTVAKLASAGEEVCLYTYLCVREDALELIGFYTMEELEAFKMLITVSGVGPKAAIAVLSLFTVSGLISAVSTGDTKKISKASGIGAKTAARIVLELKDKIAVKLGTPADDAGAEEYISEEETVGNRAEAVRALMGLGYSMREAEEAIRGLDPTASLESLLTAALRKMGTNL